MRHSAGSAGVPPVSLAEPNGAASMAVGAIPPYRRALGRRRNETGKLALAVWVVERPESGLIPPDRAAE